MSIGVAVGPTVPPVSADEEAGLLAWEQISGPDGLYTAQADLSGATVQGTGKKSSGLHVCKG